MKPRPMNCHPKRSTAGHPVLFAAILMLVTIKGLAAQLLRSSQWQPLAIAVLGEVSMAVFHAEAYKSTNANFPPTTSSPGSCESRSPR